MKLYYAPGACSLAVHIAAKEANIPLELEKVDLSTKKTEAGEDFLSINPKGYVPALKLDNGRVLTECGALVEYIADLAPQANLAPPKGSFERAEMRSWLYFIATEIHKTMGALFAPTVPPDTRAHVVDRLKSRFATLEDQLGDGRLFLMGNSFQVVDAYAHVIIGYALYLKIDMAAYPKLIAYCNRIGERDAVVAVRKEENSR